MTLYDKYIHDVQTGKILVPETIALAVQRHVDDIAKSEKNKSPYYFDREQADKYISFISMMRLTDQDVDKDGKKPLFPIQPFQAFFIASVVGWRHKKNKTVRRYTDIYFQVARKNAKSTLVAAMIVAHFYLDKKIRGEFYTAATSREQAGEVFEMALAIIRELCDEYPEIKDRTAFMGKLSIHRIIDLQTKSFIAKVSREANTLEGKGCYCGSADEYHIHKTNAIISSIKKGGVKHDSPIMYRLTTPGFNIGGPCHEHYEYCKKILKGSVENDNIFAMIFELDKDDDWQDKKNWGKANPNLGASPKLHALESEFIESKAKGGFAIVDFKTKHLSMWVSSASEWIPDDKYMASCSVWELQSFKGAQCTAGLDMAYSDQGDICAFSMFIPDLDNPPFGRFFVHYWIPESKANDGGTKNTLEIDYLAMAEGGFITLTKGETTDYDTILADLIWYHENFQIHRIYFDAWNISYFYEQMEKAGLNVFKFTQSTGHMSPPTKRLGEMIHKKECDFGMNPITRWMFSNVMIKEVGSGLIKMERTNKQRKIDGPVSAVMAYAAWIDHSMTYKPYDPQIIKL
ncbi:MAG TPA: terminase large subunit [Saprospiraceae bacterium]|nr:terminase large subunit [Saprospiraceae bacterium]